jgi:hypothetical protein
VLCSNCGFENPAAHRFCGMCGTPLPQPPITAPGAQSTVEFARSALEVPQTTSSTSASYFSQAEQAESLEQFIAGFRYTPPAEEEEVTMTGDKPVLDPGTNDVPPTPVSVSDEPASMAESRATVEEPRTPQALPAEEAPVLETVVMEPPPFATKGIREQAPERSQFLDLSVPPVEETAKPAASSIVGPSFLGLSDAPASAAYIADEDAPHKSHWRAWAAVIVIFIFAGLGFLEWRAEKQQTENGPIGIMKMQIQRLKGKSVVLAPASTTATTPESAQPGSTSQPSGSGPEMQVAPQQKPQTTNPAPDNNRNATPGKPANPAAASNPSTATPAQSASSEKSNVSANVPTTSQKTAAAPAKAQAKNDASAEAANANSAASIEKSSAPKSENPAKTAPGTEELAKAANASDSAAASAWLWKSVAKGNPEAPIKLANMYIKGDGVPQSCEQALILLRSAAAKENAAARSRLGSLYASGTCVQRNRVRAYEYMSEAIQANPNAAWARDFRQQLWMQMNAQERQQAQQYRNANYAQ